MDPESGRSDSWPEQLNADERVLPQHDHKDIKIACSMPACEVLSRGCMPQKTAPQSVIHKFRPMD